MKNAELVESIYFAMRAVLLDGSPKNRLRWIASRLGDDIDDFIHHCIMRLIERGGMTYGVDASWIARNALQSEIGEYLTDCLIDSAYDGLLADCGENRRLDYTSPEVYPGKTPARQWGVNRRPLSTIELATEYNSVPSTMHTGFITLVAVSTYTNDSASVVAIGWER